MLYLSAFKLQENSGVLQQNDISLSRAAQHPLLNVVQRNLETLHVFTAKLHLTWDFEAELAADLGERGI